jgi:hypothetical protein
MNNYLEDLINLPAKKRLDALFVHENPSSLVGMMHAHDILLTIREVGAQDALELLELLKPEQVQELFDLELWHHDDLDFEKAGFYLSLLWEANAENALHQLDGIDIELLGLMFKLVTKIYDQTLDEEPAEYSTLYSCSPDGRFIICFSSKAAHKSLAQFLYDYLEALYGSDMKKALVLLENIRFELASGLEEASLRLRNNRFLDMGILPRDERLEYFSTLTLNALKKIDTPSYHSLDKSALKPLAHNIHDRHIFLKQAIQESFDVEKELYYQSLTHASLNMHASLSGDFGDRENMTASVEYVKTLCEYGLAQASKATIANAAHILRSYGIKAMIRLGRTALVSLRKLLNGDQGFLFGDNFSYLDSPLREVARALMLSEPRFYEGLVDEKKFNIRFFASLSELNATLKAVHEIRFRAQCLGPKVLGFDASMLKNSALSHASLYARALIEAYNKNIFINQKLDPCFQAFAEDFTATIAKKLSTHCAYELCEAQERCSSFLTAILVQLEQNHELLVG